MSASTFIFKAGRYDEEFHRLDQRIAGHRARDARLSGRRDLGERRRGVIQNVHSWESEQALRQLIEDPVHAEAKAKEARWLDGYRAVIAKVIRECGDGRLATFSKDEPARR